MKRARLLIMIVPALFLAGTLTGPMEQLASAADGRGGGARQGSTFRGAPGGSGSRTFNMPRSGGGQHGAYRGSYGSSGDYVRGGAYSRHGAYDGRGSYYRGSGSRHGGYYGRGGYYGGYYGRGGYYGHGHHNHNYVSTSIWFGPSWGWGAWDPFYYPYYPYYYRYPYYGPSTTVVIPQEPQEYIMRAPTQEETGYWYYCKDPKGYYPYVERCPGGWMKVVPREPPDAGEE